MQLELSTARAQLAKLSTQANTLAVANENLSAELIEQKQQAKRANAALISRAKELTAVNSNLQGRLAHLKAVEDSPDVKAFNDLQLPDCLAWLLNNTASSPGVSGGDCQPINSQRLNEANP